MTGEISLRGLVLPVGGIKEKVLAAHRAGISHIIVPQGNARELEELPEDARRRVRTAAEHVRPRQIINHDLLRRDDPVINAKFVDGVNRCSGGTGGLFAGGRGAASPDLVSKVVGGRQHGGTRSQARSHRILDRASHA
jgi:hypothetical protein